MKDTVYRDEAIANIKLLYEDPEVDEHDKIWNNAIFAAENEIRRHTASAPSAQLERDKPIKPNETIDRSWGIPTRQAVCPKCDYYLGHVFFIGDGKGTKVTYCETCGQAIDWEGWDLEENKGDGK